MRAVLHHYDFERSRHTDAYQQQVYRGAGLVLWQANSDGAAFCIRLRALSADRWEGDLSVELYTNGVLLWRMGFAYLDASVLSGPDSGPVIFISRNQSLRSAAEMKIFQAHFKQTAPPYFCLAAIAGVAAAHAMTRIAGVKRRAQIAHEQHGSSVSVHSYDVLWQHFQGVECGPHAFAIPVPLSSRPLTDKQARHRARAAARRKAWSAVSDSAAAAITATMKPNDDPTPRADGYRAAPADAVGRTAKRSSAG